MMTNRELAEILWQKKNEEKEFLKTLDHYQSPKLDTAAMTVFKLLQDDKDCPVYPYACMEVLSRMQGSHPDFMAILKDAIDGFEKLSSKGLPGFDIEDLRTQYDHLCKRKEYIDKVSNDAEHGVWSESVKDYIDGFELINGKIGSFHDSELIAININNENGTVDTKFHMCNGTNSIVEIRLEGCVDYQLYTDTIPVYLYFGYFYERNGFLTLDMDPLGYISAKSAKVLSVTSMKGDI